MNANNHDFDYGITGDYDADLFPTPEAIDPAAVAGLVDAALANAHVGSAALVDALALEIQLDRLEAEIRRNGH